MSRWRRPLVFTNGCFDLLHVGHLKFLESASLLGASLMVAVNSDASVRALKGEGRPINSAADRIAMLRGLWCVDYVLMFEGRDPCALIERVRPDIYVKGGDYRDTFDQLPEVILQRSLGGRAVLMGHITDRSTTRIVEQIRGASR